MIKVRFVSDILMVAVAVVTGTAVAAWAFSVSSTASVANVNVQPIVHSTAGSGWFDEFDDIGTSPPGNVNASGGSASDTAFHTVYLLNEAHIVSTSHGAAEWERELVATFDRHLDIRITAPNHPVNHPFDVDVYEMVEFGWHLELNTVGPDGVSAEAEAEFDVTYFDGSNDLDSKVIQRTSSGSIDVESGADWYPHSGSGVVLTQDSDVLPANGILDFSFSGSLMLTSTVLVQEQAGTNSSFHYWSIGETYVTTSINFVVFD